MRGAFRALAVASFSLVAGTWVGLGHPEMDRLRAAATSSAPAPVILPSPGILDDPPLPQAVDPSLVPSFSAWPTTNPERKINRAWMVAEGPIKKPGDGRRLVTLTFDDGPTHDTTPAVLKLLRRHKVRATFFVIGSYLDGESNHAKHARDVLNKVVAAGHLVGNHTHDHSLLTRVSHAQAIEQIDRGAASIERVTGVRPVLFRPPYGRLDEFGERALRERNLELLLWSVEKHDMQRDDPNDVFRDLVAQLDYKEGGIILLHDVKPSSVRVLERLLDFLRDRPYDPTRPEKWGYDVVDLPHYLRAVAESPMPYADRDELERAREASGRTKRRPPVPSAGEET